MAVTEAKGANGGNQTTFDTTIALTGLAPGAHTLEIVVRLNDKVVRREIPIVVR